MAGRLPGVGISVGRVLGCVRGLPVGLAARWVVVHLEAARELRGPASNRLHFREPSTRESSSRHHEHKKGSSIQTKKGADAAIADDAPVRKSRVVQVLAPPKDSDVPPSRLPCAAYPSDHLCIAADIAFD